MLYLTLCVFIGLSASADVKPGDDCTTDGVFGTDNDDAKCEDGITNMKCRQGKCTCLDGSIWVESKAECLKTLGQDCNSANECAPGQGSCKNVGGRKQCCNWNDLNKECIDPEFVMEVVQNYVYDVNGELVKQIKKELQASYVYQAYASYFQRADVALMGVKKFFSAASLEERDHAQMLIDYVNLRGGHAEFGNIDLESACKAVLNHQNILDASNNTLMCICNFVAEEPEGQDIRTGCESDRSHWKNALMAFEDALVTERFVNSELLKIHKIADDAKDAHLSHILEHEFLDEQVSSINKLAQYVTRLRSFKGNYFLGEYIFDQNLSK